MTATHRALTFLGTLTAGAMIAASTIATAHAEPDDLGPRDVGAHTEDASGTPGPNFDEPVSIPGVGPAPEHPGDDATDEELDDYDTAMRQHQRDMQAHINAKGLEAARQAAKAYRECIERANENEIC